MFISIMVVLGVNEPNNRSVLLVSYFFFSRLKFSGVSQLTFSQRCYGMPIKPKYKSCYAAFLDVPLKEMRQNRQHFWQFGGVEIFE